MRGSKSDDEYEVELIFGKVEEEEARSRGDTGRAQKKTGGRGSMATGFQTDRRPPVSPGSLKSFETGYNALIRAELTRTAEIILAISAVAAHGLRRRKTRKRKESGKCEMLRCAGCQWNAVNAQGVSRVWKSRSRQKNTRTFRGNRRSSVCKQQNWEDGK